MVPIIVFVGIIVSIITFIKYKSIELDNKKNILFYNDIKSLKGRDFCLFLRAFKEDEYSKKDLPISWATPFGSPSKNLDLEIYNQLNKQFSLIKITNTIKGNSEVGASQISLENDWQDKVLNLMSKSKHIIIKPSITEGLIWELDQIFKMGYISKTIFIGSFGDSNLKEVEKVMQKRFFKILEERYNIILKQKPILITHQSIYFFTIINLKISYKNCFTLNRIIRNQANI